MKSNARRVPLAVALLGLVGLCLLGSPSAVSAASFEQVGCFAGSLPGPKESCKPVSEEKIGEEVQLGGLSGMAVNYTGAGGVPKGTVYGAIQSRENVQAVMYVPEPSGGLKFVEAWVVTGDGGPYVVCGPPGELPNGETSHPSCTPHPETLPGGVDLDIDESTGNVYVFNPTFPGARALSVYSADGGEEIARFGEKSPTGQLVSESPEKVHQSLYPGALAVNEDGEVYLFDANNFGSFYHRLMVFRPQTPGIYSNYVYAGEVLAGPGAESFPTAPVLDGDGNIIVGGGSEGEKISEFAPETPKAFPSSHAPPTCTFTYEKSGITTVAPNSLTGELFFFSYKKPKLIHRLSPCEGGVFKEIGTTAIAPERGDLWGLAFDPVRKLAPERPPGVLYAGAPGAIPSSGLGKGEPGQGALGYIFAPPIEAPPVVSAEAAINVGGTSAQLQAKVDPKGFRTHYVFQYLTDSEYVEKGEAFEGALEAPIGGASLEGTGAQSVGATVAGLTPDTPYRFRVVAESNCKPAQPSVVCETDGDAAEFRTFPAQAAALPDGRAWELVSPPEKFGGQVLPADPRLSSCEGKGECKPGSTYSHFPTLSLPNGDGLAYEGTGFGTSGASNENQYVSRRTASGWQTVNPTPQVLFSKGGRGYLGVSSDLTQAVISQLTPALSTEAPLGYENYYVQSSIPFQGFIPILKQAPPHRVPTGLNSLKLRYVGSSSDGSRVFLEANDALTEATPVAPPAEDGGEGKYNLYEWSAGQISLVNVKPGNVEAPAGGGLETVGRFVSADGSTVFWSDETGQVYARIDAEATLEVAHSSSFLAAATDGSRVLLQDGCLYLLETEQCTDLTGSKGGFKGLVGQSDDLSHVYFVDAAVLTGEEENSEGAKAQAGKNNLYSWNSGATAFVATLAAGDNGGGVFELAQDWLVGGGGRTADASPGGRFVAFLSEAQLTNFPNVGPCESDHEGGRVNAPCPEVFIYDSSEAKLRCASCSPSGSAPLGLSVLRVMLGGRTLPGSHYLADSGRLFFDSQNSIVPRDTNEGVEDVYEWEPQGVGSCERAEGCVSLISGGRENTDSNLLTADSSGDNVFFTTRERLVAADTDGEFDAYDARANGGFAGESELPPQLCQGEGCLPPPVLTPEPSPPSATLSDPGNVKPAKSCKKGQVRKKGKCVRKHRGKKGTGKHGGAK
jgi:hypothetical protein